MNSTAPFFNFGPCDNRPPVLASSKRNMLLTRAGETTPRHCSRGELATVERQTLDQLDPGDVEIL